MLGKNCSLLFLVGYFQYPACVTTVEIDCSANFSMTGEVALNFTFEEEKPKISSIIQLPVPPVDVNCGKFSVPAQPVLQE